MRGTKTVNGVKSEYLYVGDQLRYEKRGTTELYYGYDGAGSLASIQVYLNGTNKGVFYALTNAQGDVVALCNASGTKVVSYEYDDWGVLLWKLLNDI